MLRNLDAAGRVRSTDRAGSKGLTASLPHQGNGNAEASDDKLLFTKCAWFLNCSLWETGTGLNEHSENQNRPLQSLDLAEIRAVAASLLADAQWLDGSSYTETVELERRAASLLTKIAEALIEIKWSEISP